MLEARSSGVQGELLLLLLHLPSSRRFSWNGVRRNKIEKFASKKKRGGEKSSQVEGILDADRRLSRRGASFDL